MVLQRKKLLYGSKLLAAYVVLGLFLAAPAVSYAWRSDVALEQTAKAVAHTLIKPATAEQTIGRPVSITFVRHQKVLPVTAGQYSEALASWTVADKEVQWIQTGEKLIGGQPEAHAILYGHATTSVLGITNDLVAKDIVIIITEKGVKLAYQYVTDETVLPTNLTVLTETNKNRLTLITCKGAHNEYRRLLKFQFEGVVQ